MNKSETITKLSAALVQFSGKMTKVIKDSTNPHFKNRYASLSTMIEHTQQPLSECGLSIIQMPTGKNELETILLHESGEFISSCYEMTPSKNDPQGLGSAITYQRRYAYGAILNLNIDEDDDANKASEKPKETPKVDMKWLTDDQFKIALASDKKGIESVLKIYDGKNGKSMKKEYREQLTLKLQEHASNISN